MEPFRTLTSLAAPLPLKDVDTDLIIPASFLTSIAREGFAEGLFDRLRRSDPRFFMNDPRFRNARILVAGANFGCGSSREHAVWALQGAGFRVIIGSSFADIFSANAAKNGLLLVRLSSDEVASILAAAQEADLMLTVDLGSQTVSRPDGTVYRFEHDPFRKTCLLDGLDDLDYLLCHAREIRAHFAGRRQ